MWHKPYRTSDEIIMAIAKALLGLALILIAYATG